MSFEHQDWNPVVVKKRLVPIKEAVVKTGHVSATAIGAGSGKSHVNHATHSSHNADIPAWKIEKMADADTGPAVKYVSKEAAQAVIKGRVAMKLTQAQLAQRLNIPEKDVKEIESGKAVENKALLSKIKRALNITI
jgi:putative transcription factor